MKKILISTFFASVIVLAGSGTVSAQDDGMRIIPVELYTCTFNNRQGPDNLDRVVDDWNEWADAREWNDYAAWTLTPYYYGPEQEFDVIWLGAGKDAVALGTAQEDFMANNGGLWDDFNEVFTCDAHANYASINHKAPAEGATPANSVLTFSDCSFREGASFAAVGAAMAEWSQYLTDAGSTAGIWHWYPAYGGGGEEFDFKWLQAYENMADLGADYERYGNGRGFEVRGRLLGHLIDCDSARAYRAQSRRFVQLR
jgi:hypothetical protein